MSFSISRRIFTGLAAATALTVSAVSFAGDAPRMAKDFTLTDSNGVQHSLSDFSDQTVVLEWTNDGCPYVKKHYNTNNMQTLQADATADGVVWLSIISSAPGKQGYVDGAGANALTAERGASPTAVLLDPTGDVGRLYGALTTPHMFVIDKGEIVYEGAIDDNSSYKHETVATASNYVTAALDAVAAGEAPAVGYAKPYGCSVKY